MRFFESLLELLIQISLLRIRCDSFSFYRKEKQTDFPYNLQSLQIYISFFWKLHKHTLYTAVPVLQNLVLKFSECDDLKQFYLIFYLFIYIYILLASIYLFICCTLNSFTGATDVCFLIQSLLLLLLIIMVIILPHPEQVLSLQFHFKRK